MTDEKGKPPPKPPQNEERSIAFGVDQRNLRDLDIALGSVQPDTGSSESPAPKPKPKR